MRWTWDDPTSMGHRWQIRGIAVKRQSALPIALLVLAAGLAACAGGTATPSPSPTPAPTASPTAVQAIPTPATTPSPTVTPAPTPTATPAPPAAPTAVKIADLPQPAKCPAAYSVSCFEYKVTWTEANPAGVTIKIYAVTKCLSKPHCTLAATKIPAADLVLVSSSAASKGSVTFIVGDGESQGDGWVVTGGKQLPIWSVVVQASSASGTSPIVIAWTS
jgi:hypothetical protein